MSDTDLKKLAQVISKAPSKRYLTYIRSLRWQEVRDEHLERCDRWCEICRKAKACQVHHWTYVRLGYEHPLDLCAVCVTCHHRLHSSLIPAVNDNQLFLPFKETG